MRLTVLTFQIGEGENNMGSKAQGKKSSEHAKYMKEHGVMRRTFRCPVNHLHFHTVGRNLPLTDCGSSAAQKRSRVVR